MQLLTESYKSINNMKFEEYDCFSFNTHVVKINTVSVHVMSYANPNI